MSRIPTGFRHEARGCEERATLGNCHEMKRNPEGVVARAIVKATQPRWGRNRLCIGDPGWLVPRNPGLDDTIPLGLAEIVGEDLRKAKPRHAGPGRGENVHDCHARKKFAALIPLLKQEVPKAVKELPRGPCLRRPARAAPSAARNARRCHNAARGPPARDNAPWPPAG